MAGYDQKSNVVLSDSKERVYSMDEGVEEIPLGLYLVKGDQMCVILIHLFLVTTPAEDTSFVCFYDSICASGSSFAVLACSSESWTKRLTRLWTSQPYARNLSRPYDTDGCPSTRRHVFKGSAP